jgi:hypothetical protein
MLEILLEKTLLMQKEMERANICGYSRISLVRMALLYDCRFFFLVDVISTFPTLVTK